MTTTIKTVDVDGEELDSESLITYTAAETKTVNFEIEDGYLDILFTRAESQSLSVAQYVVKLIIADLKSTPEALPKITSRIRMK